VTHLFAGLALLIVCLLLVVVALQLLLLRRQRSATHDLVGPLTPYFHALERGQERAERSFKEESARNRDEAGQHARHLRSEVASSLKNASDTVARSVSDMTAVQRSQLDSFGLQLEKLVQSNAQHFDVLRGTIEQKLNQIQAETSRQLEEMRVTVNEKLQSTLEQRLTASFEQVTLRLEQVHKGLGEMQALASGVGDLKRVLTNVKTRGTWGEVQLGNLLSQILTAEQYATNVATKLGSDERVEYAIRLPGQGTDKETEYVWLPIDAKFPKEDYERLIDAADRADSNAVESAARDLETRVKLCARDIRNKYIHPPATTDFAIMFLPTEGLYAEVLRRNGLVDLLQREYRVTVAGPTTLAALLNSLQMGFRTLAIQKRSSEVWSVLGAVKTEFRKFSDVLAAVKQKLEQASNTIEKASVRTRAIERKLRDVETGAQDEHATLMVDEAPLLPSASNKERLEIS
jgi:DNA recombination protein RmuC